MENTQRHPLDPQSNVKKVGNYDPDKYILDNVSMTIKTHEDLTPGRPPCLTQVTVAKFLQPLTRELVLVPPRPKIDELPDAVLERIVAKDKAFWVDKPGANAYTLHDAYYSYGMQTVMVKPIRQDVFPRSFQYDLDCVKYRRTHACDGLKALKQPEGQRTIAITAECRDCKRLDIPGLNPFQQAWAKDPGMKRWKNYPDHSATLSFEEVRNSMDEVGRPYKNEAINWYYENYPPVKYETIMRKFAK